MIYIESTYKDIIYDGLGHMLIIEKYYPWSAATLKRLCQKAESMCILTRKKINKHLIVSQSRV